MILSIVYQYEYGNRLIYSLGGSDADKTMKDAVKGSEAQNANKTIAGTDVRSADTEVKGEAEIKDVHLDNKTETAIDEGNRALVEEFRIAVFLCCYHVFIYLVNYQLNLCFAFSNRGSYIRAHVLLNLLNKLRKRDKMRGLLSILSLFRNDFNKFN